MAMQQCNIIPPEAYCSGENRWRPSAAAGAGNGISVSAYLSVMASA